MWLFIGITGCSDAYHSPGSENPGGYGKLENNFQSIEANIIRPLCVQCHSGADAPHGIYLTSYEAIINSPVFPPLVIPGKPNESSLYKSVLSGKMPKENRRLNQYELKVIYDWILSGAYKVPPTDDEPPDDGDEPCEDDEPCD